MGGNPERRRSLGKDDRDWKHIRHSRDRHLGFSVSNEYYQNVPFLFNREALPYHAIGHFKGRSIFVICNGPSFAQLDHSLLRKPGVITYGMNNGPKSFRPYFWSIVDDPTRFMKSIWLDPLITKLIPLDHFEKKIFDNEKWEMTNMRVGECPNVWGFRRNEKFVANRWLFEDTINWGCHKDYGGGRSILLPVVRLCFLMGFRKVYLLGCDFNMSEANTYHFDEQRTKGAVNCNKSTYDRLQNEYFPSLKPHFDEAGFQVFNCNSESGLKIFPFVSFEEAIAEATAPLGDVENERTWGMYSDKKKKAQFKSEPAENQKKNIDPMGQPRVIEPQTVIHEEPRQGIVNDGDGPRVIKTLPLPLDEGGAVRTDIPRPDPRIIQHVQQPPRIKKRSHHDFLDHGGFADTTSK